MVAIIRFIKHCRNGYKQDKESLLRLKVIGLKTMSLNYQRLYKRLFKRMWSIKQKFTNFKYGTQFAQGNDYTWTLGNHSGFPTYDSRFGH